MDHGFGLVKTISLPQTSTEIRGVTVAPATHMLFISYGGDGGSNGNGSVLAYDLVAERVVWTVNLATGIDSGQVSPDGKLLYMPTGENTASGIWDILDTSNGAVIGTIQGGARAHNTVVSNDGRYVYLGGRGYNYLGVYDTSIGKVRYLGPLVDGVRPFTVNGSNTIAFSTATNFDGFQVSSITTGAVLFTVSFGAVPSGFRLTAPSHGVSLSPDEKQLYVIDSVNKEVQVYDVSRVSEGIAPTQLGVIPVAGLIGTRSPCVYECGRGGWLQHSLDGRFVFVGESGEVIETATRKVLTTLAPLLNTKKSLEIDWANGVPIATSGRIGVGHVG
jgi:DNA-binding beta-propeller fold protein YncE